MRQMRSVLVLVLLSGALCSAPALHAQTAWIALESEHFLLYTDTNSDKGERLLNDLEGRYQVFAQTFQPLERELSRIRLVLLDNRRDFLDWVPELLKSYDHAAYLLTGRGGPFILARDSSPESIADDVGHSLGHLLLSRSVLWQPFWLQEGMGEYIRRLGRGAGDDAVTRDDGFALADVLTIVPSQDFDDLGEGGPFRQQSYHLLRILVDRYPEELNVYLRSLMEKNGFASTPRVDSDRLESQLFRYEDSPLPPPAAGVNRQDRPVTEVERDVMLGDLAASAGFGTRARDYYSKSSMEEASRIGLAVLGQGRDATAGRRTFEQLVEDFPESGLAHYYLGILQPETEQDLRRQIVALERAVDLMPRSGRARAELGWLYALDDRPSDAIPLVDQALDLEPGFGDRFYEILAETQMRLGDYQLAGELIEIAASLPHSDRSSLEHYDRLVPEFLRKMDLHRREREAERVEALRRDVESLADRVDPRPVPVPEQPAPIGRISYSISRSASREVTAPEIREAPLPEYTDDLRRRHIAGRVVLEINLDRRGRISDLQVRSSDDPELAEAALDAVGRWRFDPARRQFESTEYSFQLILTFYLE